ncbi:MAG: hypothetical protein HQK60_19390, partial [Deltaproteobacteria bacterium]|nr:hypothetical protein [Deltaproteobacteria bacterium]
GRVGYIAGVLAAQKIVREFNGSKPPELYSLLELKGISEQELMAAPGSPRVFRRFYHKGMYHFRKKNFEQALYCFQQAGNVNPDDLLTQFYIGVCHMYVGQKNLALAKFELVLDNHQRNDKLTKDSRSWIHRLNDPLKIGLVFLNERGPQDSDSVRFISQALSRSAMFEIIDVNRWRAGEAFDDPGQWNRFLKSCTRKGIRVVLCIQTERASRILTDPNLVEGDFASEFSLTHKIKAYGTSKRQIVLDLNLLETAAHIGNLSAPEDDAIQSSLQRRSSDELVLSLLENEIF